MNQRSIYLAVSVLVVVTMVGVSLAVPSPASAEGATQISGIAYLANPGECTDSQGQSSDFAVRLEGDLEGCLYISVESSSCSPGGTYRETGSEIFVAQGGGNNTFQTAYRFEGKYQDCANRVGQIFGRCQHPIVAGSGTGIFDGVNGRLDFKDDIAAGNFPYRGHLR